MENHLRSFELKLAGKIVGRSLVFIGLTALTQTGGVIYLFWKLVLTIFGETLATNKFIRIVGFPTLYVICSFFVTPLIGNYFGRIPLPVFERNNVRPASVITCLLNRHYVTKELSETTFQIASELRDQHPTANLIYLDANFPFADGFPLLPHWSHSDGKKLDLAFIYEDKNGAIVNDQPTHFAYGSFVPPKGDEVNTPENCRQKGYIQYSMISHFVLFPEELGVQKQATSDLIRVIHQHNDVGKIFIEPHLTHRWGLSQLPKIRFHGCHAVRHDDHIHFQLN